jgi:hypothetical protein
VFFEQPAQSVPPKPPATTRVQLSPQISSTDAGASVSSEFLHIQPLGAAKYFDDSETGNWHVYFSMSATKQLREIRNVNSHNFGRVMKKIT